MEFNPTGMVKLSKEIDRKHIKNSLTAHGEDYTSPILIRCWREDDNFYYVPRQWALKNGHEVTLPKLQKRSWGARDFVYREGQKRATDSCVEGLKKYCGGRLSASVGFGKTLIGCDVAKKLGAKTLVLVHKTDLIEQWKSTANELFNTSAGHIKQDHWDYENPLTISTIQTLHARFDNISDEFWNEFGMVIVDEGHRMPANSFRKILEKINARYLFGVSATWRRADKLNAIWEWYLGPILHKVDKKFQGNYKQIILPTSFHDKKFKRAGQINHAKYVSAICFSEAYNNKAIEEIKKLKKENRRILVLSNRVDQLKYLNSKLKDSGLYIGECKKNELQKAKEKQVILGTTGKIGEGSDIPILDTIVVASPLGDVEQFVGRICRKFEGKQSLLVVDLLVDTPYNKALGRKREKIYEKMGFQKWKKT